MACNLKFPPPVSSSPLPSPAAAPPSLPGKIKRAFNYPTSLRPPRNLRRGLAVRANQDGASEGEINVSVLRLTLGIPGLDESYLPRYLGLGFGFLIVVNHLFGSDSPTPAQLRSEVIGIFLAVFSAALPYFGTFLKGAGPVDRSTIPEGNIQVFAISEDSPDALKEDFAWTSFILLQNTNSIAVLLRVGDKLCIRGYWNIPEEASKAQIIDFFHKGVRESGLTGIKEPIYFPLGPDSQLLGFLPKGVVSVLVQPSKGGEGFVLLAASAAYAYRDSDQSWIRAVANKFRGGWTPGSRGEQGGKRDRGQCNSSGIVSFRSRGIVTGG